MKNILCILLWSAVFSLGYGADQQSKFSMGYGRVGAPLPKERCLVAIERMRTEANMIAAAVLGSDIAVALNVEPKWSEGCSSGFETWFTMQKSLAAAIGRTRLGKVHFRLSCRYEELLSALAKGEDATNKEVCPLAAFLATIPKPVDEPTVLEVPTGHW